MKISIFTIHFPDSTAKYFWTVHQFNVYTIFTLKWNKYFSSNEKSRSDTVFTNSSKYDTNELILVSGDSRLSTRIIRGRISSIDSSSFTELWYLKTTTFKRLKNCTIMSCYLDFCWFLISKIHIFLFLVLQASLGWL